MLGIGSINNLAPRSSEDLKSTSSKDFSLSSDKAQNNTAPNSSSTQSNKTLGKKSEFSEKVDKITEKKNLSKSESKNSEGKVTYSSDKTSNVKSEPKQYSSQGEKVTKNSEGQSQVQSDKGEGEKLETSSSDYSQIVPIYPQNEFFAVQAPIPVATTEVVMSPEETLLKQLDVTKISPENQPVVQFMKDLYQKLGIPPEKLVKAFETLPTEALIQSPKAAMDTLFQKLELQPREYTKAQILFTEMIDGLNKQVKNTEYKQVQIKPTIVDQAKIQDKNLNALGATPALASSSPLQAGPQAVQPTLQPQVAQKPVKTTLEQMLQERLMQSNSMTANQAPIADFTAPTELGVKAATSPEPVFDAAFLKSLAAADVELNEGATAVEGLEGSESQKNLADLINTLESKDKNPSENSDKKDDLSKFFNVQDQKGLDTKIDFPKMIIDVGPKDNNKLNPDNIQKILGQAEAIAKKGGGEMKIQLRPDGLGEINLKIKVIDGVVGLQMITESQEAKKLIEGSLTELKSALLDHKLNLQDIKVDVSQKSSQDMLQQDAKREDAREFLGQFRQFNEGSRQGFGDTGNMVRQYRSGGKPQTGSIAPADAKDKKNNSNRRLDLVA